jgi:hypothetical protein
VLALGGSGEASFIRYQDEKSEIREVKVHR